MKPKNLRIVFGVILLPLIFFFYLYFFCEPRINTFCAEDANVSRAIVRSFLPDSLKNEFSSSISLLSDNYSLDEFNQKLDNKTGLEVIEMARDINLQIR